MFAASFMIHEKKKRKIELQIDSKTVIAYKSGVYFPISCFSDTVESWYSKPLYNKSPRYNGPYSSP